MLDIVKMQYFVILYQSGIFDCQCDRHAKSTTAVHLNLVTIEFFIITV